MGRLSAKLRSVEGYRFGFWCPGCREMHIVGHGWVWDGDVDRPTVSPSILVTGVQMITDESSDWTGEFKRDENGEPVPLRCHSFLRAGRIEFCGNSQHALAGKTVDLPDLPAALT